MSMERWNPFQDIESMRQAMDRWFDDRLLGNLPSSNRQSLGVAIDVNETTNGYVLTASVPGVRAEDLEISINRDTITLRGKSEQSEEHNQNNYVYHERYVGSFQRTIRLPEPVNAEQVDAELEHGVLKVTLPWLQQTFRHRVPVRSGTTSQQISTTQRQDAATLSGQGSVIASSSATSTGMERPAVLNNLGTTQMDSLERHIFNNDEQGFRVLAQSYGWDQPTTDQVWLDMSRHARSDEAHRAFENHNGAQNQQSGSTL